MIMVRLEDIFPQCLKDSLSRYPKYKIFPTNIVISIFKDILGCLNL